MAIKISEECAKSLEHLIHTNGFEKQGFEMFELNPHLVSLISAIYYNISSNILKNDTNISMESLQFVETGITIGVISMYQLIRIQMESNDLKTSL